MLICLFKRKKNCLFALWYYLSSSFVLNPIDRTSAGCLNLVEVNVDNGGNCKLAQPS